MLDINDILILIKGADRGDANAQFNLGLCYGDEGDSDVLDYSEAAKWFKRAAEQGHAEAQNYLGFLYDRGNGVEQSYIEAVKWFGKAAVQGHAIAQNNLGISYEYGEGVEQNYFEAAIWYRKAAEQGYSDAQTRLAICYQHGYGVSQNNEEAIKWYKRAADQGDRTAAEQHELLTSWESTSAYHASSRYDNYQAESIMKTQGYTVSQTIGLTNIQRQRILEKIVDECQLSAEQICSYLDWFIDTRSEKKQYKNAVEKWMMDREHIKNYKKK